MLKFSANEGTTDRIAKGGGVIIMGGVDRADQCTY